MWCDRMQMSSWFKHFSVPKYLKMRKDHDICRNFFYQYTIFHNNRLILMHSKVLNIFLLPGNDRQSDVAKVSLIVAGLARKEE